MPAGQRILIVGGGIGGLAAAVALRRRGLDAQVFEQASELREIGAGLSVWPNATNVLRAFGLLDEALKRSSRLDRLRLQTSTGAMLTETGAVSSCGTPSICIHRADLLALLKDALPAQCISLGARFENLAERERSVVARFADGREVEGDALIGADGLYSVVRERILGSSKPAYRGYHAWRGVAHYPGAALGARAVEVWGAGRRFGFEPLSEARCFWYATENAHEGDLGSPASWKEEVACAFGGWPPPIPQLIEATPGDAVLKHGIFDPAPVKHFGAGRVTLLGDAANPTTPNLGQGACMALEDAFVLAECLAAGEAPAALRGYESRRYRRRRFITLESRRIGRVAQYASRPGVALRTLLVRLLPAAITDFQHRRYYAFCN